MPTIKKVRNWKEYNKSLKKRREILFSFTKDFYEDLYYKGEQKKGDIKIYCVDCCARQRATIADFSTPLLTRFPASLKLFNV